MPENRRIRLGLIGVSLLILAMVVYQLPPVKSRLSWRIDSTRAYLRGVLNPVEAIPTANAAISQADPAITPIPIRPTATSLPQITPTATLAAPEPTPLPSPSPTPLPESVVLAAPAWEKQDWNNCGPATLAQYLRFYGWEGDQFTISDLLKPIRGDRNVNVEELVFYARNHAGWLNTIFRVGGNLEMLKAFIAAGIPVIIEEGYILDTGYWPNDDRWAGHYLLVTGYDDATQTFIGQDSFVGADRLVEYQVLDESWQVFNRVFILSFLPGQEGVVRSILGPHWDAEYNREQALLQAEIETEQDPENPFAWFNLGSNLVYFGRYQEAGEAYDVARQIGLPQRMLRYQFGPFFAYFHGGRLDDLMALTEYALQRTPNSEEALLWHGWGLYRQGDTNGAIGDFQAALEANRFYQDAQYALNFVRENP